MRWICSQFWTIMTTLINQGTCLVSAFFLDNRSPMIVEYHEKMHTGVTWGTNADHHSSHEQALGESGSAMANGYQSPLRLIEAEGCQLEQAFTHQVTGSLGQVWVKTAAASQKRHEQHRYLEADETEPVENIWSSVVHDPQRVALQNTAAYERVSPSGFEFVKIDYSTWNAILFGSQVCSIQSYHPGVGSGFHRINKL